MFTYQSSNLDKYYMDLAIQNIKGGETWNAKRLWLIILFLVSLFLLICSHCWLGWGFRRRWGTKATIPEENVVHKFPDVTSFHGIAIVNSAPPSGQSCDSIWSQFRNRFWVRSKKNVFFYFIEISKIHFLVLEKQTLLIITVYKYQGGVHYMLRLVQIEKNAISRV